MSTVVSSPRRSLFAPLADSVVGLGDWAVFAARTVAGIFRGSFRRRDLLRISVEVGVASVGIVAVTGAFIGMVLAVQTYGQFHRIGLDTSLGAVIHLSVVRELGPVLAAVMLAGRIGSAMAAELATMRVTEQLDALACLGVDPVKYLAAPRVIACVLLLPLLTVLADLMGVIGSSVICLHVYQIDSLPLLAAHAGIREGLGCVRGLGEVGGLRRRTVADRLPSRVQEARRRGGRRPRRDGGVRVLLHRDPGPRFLPGDGGELAVRAPVAAVFHDGDIVAKLLHRYSECPPHPSSNFATSACASVPHQVLGGIDLMVSPHETLAVIGESGCGKTVLLKLIVGPLAAYRGRGPLRGRPDRRFLGCGPHADAAARRVSLPAGGALRQPRRLR